jgi:hypothetical protein
MSPAQADNVPLSDHFGIWNGIVHYRHEVLEAVRSQAVNGLNSLAEGGLEVGGVLYGEKRADHVRIMSCRQLDCEHAYGPAFELSEADEARFREMLKPVDGMRAIGWYGSHTRAGVGLGSNDSAILERFFPERGSVALLVKPMREGPVEATFHVQGCAEPGPRFSILPSRGAETSEPAQAARAAGVPPPNQMVTTDRPRLAFRAPLVRWASVGVCLAILGATYLSMEPDTKAATVVNRIGLQAYPVADRNLRIEWDRTAAVVRNARAGRIEISDGRARYALALNSEQLRNSSLTYAQQSDVVDVSLKLETGAEESAHVVSQPPSRAPQSPKVLPKPVPAPVQPQVAQIPSPPQAVEPERKSLETESPRLQASLRRFVAPTEKAAVRTSTALPDPPPALGSSIGVPLLASMPKLPTSLPSPVRVAPKRTSGRLIWTGRLNRSGVVEFDGASATVGSLIGSLPGSPAKLTVFPAELKDDGLIVYVADASRHNRMEAPSALTGWNRLIYEWDPERVNTITVLELPNSSNQFARLVLRNERRSCTVIVVDWRTD